MESREVSISLGPISLQGLLTIPPKAKAIILFAHGSGSGRFSPRNQFVAGFLAKGGFATLLMDLLTPAEEEIDEVTRHLRFDIPLLAERLIGCTDWVLRQKETKGLKVGYFGASTGAAAALIAAAKRPKEVFSVISRGGRPDLAGNVFSSVQAPTLLIVGGNDFGVIELNESALAALKCQKKLELVEGATHLFEEPGTLEKVAELALAWYVETIT
jgi:pimeloyl-ACP methyl ester carboxylesterase